METPRLRTGDGKCKMQNLQCKRQNEVAGIRAGRLRWLVPCLVVGLMPLMAGAWSPVARAGVLELGEISRPRFASGDVDGDGQAELIVGGRVGPFRAVTDPPTSGRARVEVYRREGRLFQPMGAGFELSQVADVASGDLDGDGRWEVVAVGGGRMVILGWQAGSLAIRHVESLGNEWSDRVAAGDVDGDGRHELAVTLYGIGDEKTDNFGRQCLLARRLSESGVRFVQCSHGYWDQHSNLKKQHASLAKEVDQPICGLLTDLQARGLLDETLVIWGGEFGRTPTAQGKDGRDHNPHAFTWWFAGGGTKAGVSYGETDEFGYYAANDKVHIHDLHATILHLLGIEHEALTYRHAGRDFRLTDVSGRVVHEIIA